MKHIDCPIEALALEMSVGDLVRFVKDEDMEYGLGLIAKICRGSEDISDFVEGLDWVIGKPKIKVLWKHGAFWMDADEIAVVKSIKD